MSIVTEEARQYAQNIIDTVREALIVLDEDLRVVSAGCSFYRQFQLRPDQTEGRLIYELGSGQWDIPDLRRLLETVVAEQTTVEDFEVRHHFETIGEKIMTLNARRVVREGEKPALILLAIEDVTEARRSEEKFRRAQKTLQDTIDSITDGFLLLDKEWHIEEFSTTGAKILGMKRQELVGNNIWEVFPYARNTKFYAQYRRAVEMKEAQHFEEFYPEPLNRWLEVHCYPREEGLTVFFRDVTESKKSEEQLYRAYELIRSVTQGTQDMIAAQDLDFRYIYFNEAYSREFKKLWKQDITVGTNMIDAMAPWPKEQRRAREFWERAMSGESFKITAGFGPKEEERQYYDLSYNPLRDEQGRVVGAAHFLRNVTEEVRTKQALRESEEKFRVIFEQAAIGIGRVGFHDAKWIDVNTAFCDMLGYKAEELKATPWPQITHPDDIDIDLIPFKKMAAGELDSYSVEKRFIHRKGHPFWARLTLSLVRDEKGRPAYEIAIIEDINERKDAELALEKSEERLQRALGIESVGVLFFDMESVFTGANDAFLRMIGYDRRALERGELRSDRVTLPEWMPRTWQAFEELQATGRFRPYEKQLVRPDGSRWWGLFAGARLGENEAVEFVIDITESKQAEQSLQYRTDELAAANADLESFTFSVSHDLRNPLQTIGSFTAILMEEYMDRLDKEGQDFLRRIDEGVKKMKGLIEDLLSLSRISKFQMKRQDVNLSKEVRGYLEELKCQDPRRRIDCVVQDNVHADADPSLIHLALENLLRNAWKFTSRKDIGRIEFGSLDKDGRTVYFIRDNGAGFDMQIAQKIFEPFKRGHAEQEFGGTGVGLSIVQRVISRHGGIVWAEGDVGRGAAFYFTLG
ncbi:MAG: PAS domain S-box protein [Chitinispirillaceae bacterium]